MSKENMIMDKKILANKIIHKVTQECFATLEIFRKGNSRTYFDDNGYYLTIIEFQPHSIRIGTFLNIAIHFLWRDSDYFSYDFYIDETSRVKSFLQFENEEQFERELHSYVECAKERVLFYRKFRDVDFAKDFIENANNKDIRLYYKKAMICAYSGNIDEAKHNYEKFMKEDIFQKDLTEFHIPEFSEYISKDYIINEIKKRRQILHSQSSMKKLKKWDG